MRDNLDLQELRERENYYKTQGRKRRNRSLIWTIGIVIVFGWLWLQFDTSAGYIYTPVDGKWIQHEYEAPAKKFIPSTDGQSLWLQTYNPHHLIEINGDSWIEYLASDVSECCFKFDGEFGTFDDFSYSTHGSSSAFYKHGKWSYREDWAPTDSIVDVALSIYTYAVMDANYDIYLIEADGEWKLVNPSQPALSQPNIVTVGETLFLIQDGIWQYVYEETAWKLYQSLTEGIQYLGNDNEHIWLSANQTLIRYTITNNKIKNYSLDDLNLSSDSDLIEVINDRSKTYLVTRNQVTRIDDESWTLADVPDTVHGITTVGVLPNGAWMIGSSDLSLTSQGWSEILTYNFFRSVIPLVVLLALIILLLTQWLIPYIKHQSIRTERSKKLIFAIFPDMPSYEPLLNDINELPIRSVVKFVSFSFVFIVVITLGVIVISLMGIIPQTPEAQTNLSTSMISLSLIIWTLQFFYRHYRTRDEDSRQHIRRNIKILGAAIVVLLIAFGAIFVFIEVLLAPIVSDASVRVGIFIVVLFIIIFLYFALFLKKPQVLFPDGLTEGNYPKALETIEKRGKNLIWGNSNPIYHGVTLYMMGNYEQAYKIYLDAIRESQNSLTILLAMYLTDVGGLLYRMGQLDRAMTVYQAAVSIQPESPYGYFGLVNFYNERREHPERSLELSREMLTKISDKPNRLVIPLISEAKFYGGHARVLANVGEFEEAERYIQKMYDFADESFVPYYAANLRADGLVKLAQGKIDEAKVLLNRALELDPNSDNANQIHKDFEYIKSLSS